MANYKGHLAGGAVCGAAYVAALTFVPVEQFAEAAGILSDWQAIAAAMVLTLLFALFPDIDTNSKGQDIFIGIAFTLDVALIINGNVEAAAYLGLIALTPIVGKHRGWTHRWWSVI